MTDQDVCDCGHIRDAHDYYTLECEVEDCPCLHFDWIEDYSA